MASNHDHHAHRNLEVVEEPLDAAGQSLADALQASFRVLKWIMAILVVLYLFSNVRRVDPHEQALVLRLGRLLPTVHEAGLVWAFPFPVDEIVPLPTRKSNELLLTSHSFHREPDEVGKPLSFISRGPGRGLNPTLDGALLTADAGLVHTQWKVTYKFTDVQDYVSQIAGDKVESAEQLISTIVETVGIQLATELTAEELIRTRVEYVQREMTRRINERLTALESGLVVTFVEMSEPTPPIQVTQAFERTQRAENQKQQVIQAARKDRTRILSEAAGRGYPELVERLEEMAQIAGDEASVDRLRADLDRLLMTQTEGKAGRRIKDAEAYYSVVVARMEADVKRYRALLPEYQRDPSMLVTRLWEETKKRIFESPGVIKFYRPEHLAQFRIRIPLDPEQARIDEALRLQQKEFEEGPIRRSERLVPVGWEAD
jgi:membrane protease subunit HflK